MQLRNPAALEVFRVDTAVYAANAPVAFTDLDISAVVGARTVLAAVRFAQGVAANRFYYTRLNADIETQSNNSGLQSGVCDLGDVVDLLVPTDANGIFEWVCDAAAFTTVTVKGYLIQS